MSSTSIDQIIDKIPVYELKPLLVYLLSNYPENKDKIEMIIDQYVTSTVPDIDPDDLDKTFLEQILTARTKKSKTRVLNSIYEQRTKTVHQLLDNGLITDAFSYAWQFSTLMDYLYHALRINNDQSFINSLKDSTYKIIENYMKKLDEEKRRPYYQYLLEALKRYSGAELLTNCEVLTDFIFSNHWENEALAFVNPLIENLKDQDLKKLIPRDYNILIFYSKLLDALPEYRDEDIITFYENYLYHIL